MRKRVIAITATLFAGLGPAHSLEPYIGQVQTFANTFCPRGWAPMHGQLLPINQNQALFSLLGTRFGGNGQTTFALPLAKPQFTLTGEPLIQCIALQGIFPSAN